VSPVAFAVAFCVILAALAVLQAGLIAGLPWGRLAWGGKNRVLPASGRTGSVIAIVLYVAFALVALNSAGVVGPLPNKVLSEVLMWIVAGYLTLSIVPNLLSKSPPERWVMTPVSAVLAALAITIALV
jgi:hypothetical protein